MKDLSTKQTITIGLMLFALFFGAGNMIFPPSLGQAAGTEVWIAIFGFIMTGVGLPVLAVAAVAMGEGDLRTLASRVHPRFGLIFTVLVYLAIGPLFAIPRTATVSFEVGIVPFLSSGSNGNALSLFLYSLIFMGVTFWLCLNPSKLVDRIGKFLTPAILLIIAILFVLSFIKPMGDFGTPAETYMNGTFSKGFLEGYLTMDTLASLVFGIVVINAIRERGVTDKVKIATNTIKAGVIAGIALALVYLALAYLGASSYSLGVSTNGGHILTNVVTHLLGKFGVMTLGLAILLACLTTSVGLVTACSQFFSQFHPKLTYKVNVVILSLFSLMVANLGLETIISISGPVLAGMYPIAIVLVLIALLDKFTRGYKEIYQWSILFTGIISFFDCLTAFGVNIPIVTSLFSYLPLYSQGIGWVVPAIIGAFIGYIIGDVKGDSRQLQSAKDSVTKTSRNM
ncbi:branched-chain amino acid transport system II carrier protein [Brevibacillus daliensis]|uniref:branched-chain amino acid transport system II carrier protein n=1 Tax=Brevibacillus daliensis TaxID=2892995 RepID=UPI001E5F5C7D|nr:branched-chain amino acid transport system II carrier protein [Brevibacillus daliensis]